MQKPNKPTFAVFFSINPDEFSVRRFALLRQFLTSKLGSDINVIDYALLSFGYFKFIIIAEADSCEMLEEILSPCNRVFEVTIVSIVNSEIASCSNENRYAVLIKHDDAKKKAFTRNPQSLCEVVKPHAHI